MTAGGDQRPGGCGPNRLEAAVIKVIASQYPDHRSALLSQLHAARVTSRRNTGVGFYTDFGVDERLAAPVSLAPPIGDLWAEISGCRDPVTFLLWLRGGYIATLEGASAGGDTAHLDLSKAGFRLLPPQATSTPS